MNRSPLPIREDGRAHQRGAAAVEFAIVATIFFTLLLGIMDFGRWLYTLNAASEATRLGARVAVVCDLNDAAIKDRMQAFLPQAADAQIVLTYHGSNTSSMVPGLWGNGCTVETCAGVTVSLSGVTIDSVAWFLPRALPIPAFTTSLPRESMLSAIDGSNNPMCQ